MKLTDNDVMLPLIERVSNAGTYQDRLRSTNVQEFKLHKIITKPKEKEFKRDTTLDPKK